VLSRVPLAEAVLSLWRRVADPLFLLSVFARHRGQGYEKEIRFEVLVQLIADALLEHQGSGRRSFERGREQGFLTASVQAVYQKLGRLPLGLSEAWLAESTARLRPVYPEAARLSVALALRELEVIIVDGKAIKRVAKRLKPLRGRKGGVLGGKALVALELRSGVVVAMATHADGETNEAKLVPALLPQVREHVVGRRLWVADRQFCDLTQPAAFAQDADQFLVRYHPKTPFYPDAAHPAQRGQDAQGRVWEQDWGWLGSEQVKHRRFVRRLTLYRPGEETIILLTDLLDATGFPAMDLFDLYLARWSIERVFQQITEVFHLQTLIGTTPQGTVFQFAFCVLLYNMVQVVRAYVAAAQARPVPTISTELLFDDVHRQLVAFTELVPAEQVEPLFPLLPTEAALRAQLTRLLAGIWTNRWLKAPTKKRKVSAPRTPIRGNQTSVFRLVAVYHKHRVNPSLK
jgi:DDE family transposase